MRRSAYLVLVLAVTFGAGQSREVPDHTRDEQAIKRLVAQFDEIWNRHEFSKTAELQTEDAVDVNVVGQRMTRSEIAKELPPWFQKAFGASTLHGKVEWIRFIRPEIAAVDVIWEMTGARCPDGSDDAKLQTYRKGLMSLIMTKQRGRWLIAVFHNMDLPVVPPGSTETDVPCQFRSPHPKAATTVPAH